MAQRNQSRFVTHGTVDDPLEQSGRFEMDADDRQFIDNQIRGIQQHILDNPGGGEAAVAQDIGKSAGSTIDRVLGIKGVPLETTDTLGVGEVWKRRGSKLRAAKPVGGWFDPVDYGAVGNNVTDDLAAFNAMFAAMSDGDTCVIPRPSVKYYLSGPLRPDKSVIIRGPGANACTLRFAVGPGLQLRNAFESGAGNAAKSHVTDIAIECTKESFSEWAPSTAYTVGQKRRCKLGSLSTLDALYQEDMGLHYVCTVAGTSGATQPEWSDTEGIDTTDGTVTWATVNHAGITISASQCSIERCTVSNTTDNGIFAYGNSLETFADSTVIRHCHVLYGDGNGILVKGYDGNVCLIEKNTVQNYTRGAIVVDNGFLSNTIVANDGVACRRSYVGRGGTSATVWTSNYWEQDCADPKIKLPNLWLGATQIGSTFAAETDCIRCTGTAYYGSVPIESTDGTTTINVSMGLNGTAGIGSFQRQGDYASTRTLWVPADSDNPGGYYAQQWQNSFDHGLEITGERSLHGIGRHRYPLGFLLGTERVSIGRKSTFVTSMHAPPDSITSGYCGKYLWRKGDIVYNCAAGSTGVAPGWIANRNGGWGGGRFSGSRVWYANSGSTQWCVGEGIEPSTANGFVYRVLRFEINAGGWTTHDRLFAGTSGTEPTWPTTPGNTVTELLDATHRIVWECWGSVGMTWAEMPAPSTTVTSGGAPLITGAPSPTSGSTAGGTHVVIPVDSSVGATGATIGGVGLTSFAIDDATHVSGTTGAHVAGAVDVVVSNAVGASSPRASAFTYSVSFVPVVSAVSPAIGDILGGDTVTIAVDSSVGCTGASVGGVALTSFSIVDSTHVRGVTGARAATASADVVVTNTIGPSTTGTGLYEYYDPTAIFDFYADGQGYAAGTWTARKGANATEATNPPTAGTGGLQLNGRNTVAYDGVNDKLEIPTASNYLTTTQLFAFCLFNANTISTANGAWYDDVGVWNVANNASAGMALNSSTPNLRMGGYSGGAHDDTQPMALSTWTPAMGKYDGTNVYARIGAGAWSAGVACGTLAALSQPIRLGTDYDTGVHAFDGRMAVIAFAKAIPSSGAITKFLAYIAARWGV